ncbi:MAG TPA: hypothetical protein DCL21_05065 [Alphaproteobacteria bacterium]|nr:hypothetical protein [Alphaproteobacteria bacterium]
MTLIYIFYTIKSMENYKQINYTIKHTTRKNSIAMVFLQTHAEIRAPKRTSKRTIESFIKKHYDFILEKLENLEFVERHYKTGEEFLIQGEKYTLNVSIAPVNDVIVDEGGINLYVQSDDYDLKKEVLEAYFKRIAQLDIKRLVLRWSKIMALFPSKVKLNRAEKRWGSCNYHTKTLNFTIRTAMLPDWVQEYIVIHELAHLLHPDHSKNFWNHVEQFMPDYKEAEKYIKTYSSLLSF